MKNLVIVLVLFAFMGAPVIAAVTVESPDVEMCAPGMEKKCKKGKKCCKKDGKECCKKKGKDCKKSRDKKEETAE